MDECVGYTFKSDSVDECWLLKTFVVDVSDPLFKTVQKRTDDLDVPSTLVSTFNTDFSYLPLVLDFKHRSIPAAVFDIQFVTIDGSNTDSITEDSIENSFQKAVTGGQYAYHVMLSADAYSQTGADHPMLYMCLQSIDYKVGYVGHWATIEDTSDPTRGTFAKLWSDDSTRDQICNIDINGYIGDLSIFNDGSLTFDQGLIYEDRLFVNKEIFAGKF